MVVSLPILETCGGTVVPKNPDKDSDVQSWTESEGTSSAEQSLLGRLGTCKGGLELPHRPGYVVRGNA